MLEGLFHWFARKNLIRFTAEICGHRTRRIGPVHAFGRMAVTEMPINQNGSVDYCLDCIGNMAIRCAWCEDPIFIGNPITLYVPLPGFKIPDHAVIYTAEPPRLVGCLGWDCAETGADRAGFWLPGDDGKGRVLRIPTVLEIMLSAKEPSALIIRDLGDIREAKSPVLIPLETK